MLEFSGSREYMSSQKIPTLYLLHKYKAYIVRHKKISLLILALHYLNIDQWCRLIITRIDTDLSLGLSHGSTYHACSLPAPARRRTPSLPTDKPLYDTIPSPPSTIPSPPSTIPLSSYLTGKWRHLQVSLSIYTLP